MLVYTVKTNTDIYDDVPATGVRRFWKYSQEHFLKVNRKVTIHK